MEQPGKWWYRIAAWVALALIGLAGLLGLYLVLSQPLLAVAYVLTAVLAAGVGWKVVFARGQGATWPYLVALAAVLVALVAETWEFFQQQHRAWAVALMVGLAAAGVGLALAVRRRYVRERLGRGLKSLGGRPFLIVNPKSGDGRAIKAGIPKLAAAQGIRVLVLEPGGSLTSLVKQAVEGKASVLGVSGGDGSIGLVAGEAMRHNVPLVVLPGGTRCHFARDIGLDPEQIEDSLRCFGGREVKIDAAEINGRVFVNNASFGLYADIVDQPGYRERKLQSGIQVLQKLANEQGSYPLVFADGGGQRREQAVAVLVGVNRYETMNLTELGGRPRLDEGVLQMTALFHLEPSLLKQLAGAVQIAKFASQRPGDLSQWVASGFELDGGGATIKAGIDGELVELDSPARLRILARALRLMVPPEGLQPRKNIWRKMANLKHFAVKGSLPNA